MPRTATIKSLPQAFRMMKEMEASDVEWGEDYRQAGAVALKEVLEGRMAAAVDRHLDEMARLERADWRNGSYSRWLLTELGEIELAVPRTRTYSALGVVRADARRAAHIDRMILACFVLGLSTRKVANLHGPHPLRRLHTRKLKPGSAYPLLPDTNHLTLRANAGQSAERTAPVVSGRATFYTA